MKAYYFQRSVVCAEGTQTFVVNAESEDEALDKLNSQGGDICDSDVDVTALGGPELIEVSDMPYSAAQEKTNG